MIDPDDLTIEPNDDDVCDDYWACDDDDASEPDCEPQEADDHPESYNPYYDGT
tara:strand:+ start:108 stop:266 length:159 start_codon:yes stop_codon:yes gene_type:complete